MSTTRRPVTPRAPRAPHPPGDEIVVDPIACTGHGMCAELFPERIRLDDWGYPIIDGTVPPHLREHAERAVKACPALALRLRKASRDRA